MSDDESLGARDAADAGRRRLYDRLDQNTRLVAIWHAAGFTTSEIADYMGITAEEVTAMLERLRKTARELGGRHC